MNQNEVLQHYEFQANIGREPNILQRIASQVIDMTDRAIVQECIKTASAAGITDLYLLDKKFVHEALAEKLEQLKNEPLTIEELRKMFNKPVWIVETKANLGYWAIAGIAGSTGMYLTNVDTVDDYGSFELYGNTWLAYRYPVEEGS